MNKPEFKAIVGSVVLAAAVAVVQSASAQSTVYDNSAEANYRSQAVGAPTITSEFGDEITLAGTDRLLSEFKIEVFAAGLGGGESLTFRLYANDGTGNAPGTLLAEAAGVAIGNGLQTLTYTDPTLVLPDRLTWTVEFAGVEGAEQAQLPIYDPPTVGSSFDDFWVNSGGTWATFRFPGGNPAGNFAANVTAVPEAGTIAYGLMGALVLAGYLRARRK